MTQDSYATSQPEPQPPADEWVPASRWPSLATVVGWVVRIGGLLLLAAIFAYFFWMVRDLNQQVMQLQTDMNAAATSQASVPTSVAATATSVAQQLASILLARQNPDQPVEEGSGPIEVSVNLLDQNGSPYAGDKRLTAEVPDGVLSAPGSPESGRRIRFNVSQGVGTLLFTPGQAGLVTITVSDEGNPAMQGAIEIGVVPRPVTIANVRLEIEPAEALSGDIITLRVIAETANGVPLPDGTVANIEGGSGLEGFPVSVPLDSLSGRGEAMWLVPEGVSTDTPLSVIAAVLAPDGTSISSQAQVLTLHPPASVCQAPQLTHRVSEFRSLLPTGQPYSARNYVINLAVGSEIFIDSSVDLGLNRILVTVYFWIPDDGLNAEYLLQNIEGITPKVLSVQDGQITPGGSYQNQFGGEAEGYAVMPTGCTSADGWVLVAISGDILGDTGAAISGSVEAIEP